MRVSLPNGQMYHVHVDNRVPYWIYSNRQDDGTMRGPSTVSEQTGNGRLPEGSTMPSQPRLRRARRRARTWRPAAAALQPAARRRERRPRAAGGGRVAAATRPRRGSPTSAAASRASPFPIPTDAEHRLRVAATATR